MPGVSRWAETFSYLEFLLVSNIARPVRYEAKTVKYLLPCECGKRLTVGTSQAGLTITCTCGRHVEVPTIVEMVKLDVADAPDAQPAPSWGPRQGCIFIGCLILLGAGSTAAYRIVVKRPATDPPVTIDREANRQQIEAMTPSQTMALWEQLRFGLKNNPYRDRPELEYEILAYRAAVAHWWQWTWIIVGIAVAGLLIAAFAWLTMGDPKSRGRASPMA
jgi:hypothetical protein